MTLVPLARSALLLAASMLIGTAPGRSADPPRWYKGNTHAHTVNSDGDSTPDDVVRWYREQRYHFLVLTDHNFVTPVDGLNALFAADERFLVIPGVEITDRAADKPVHVNALGTRTVIAPRGGAEPGEALQRDADAARAAGAIVQVNHPNFGWALTPGDAERAASAQLIEVFNGHPQVNNLGGGGAPGAEAVWDVLLSEGRTLFAVASDDLHHLKRPGERQAAGPGRGWVMVRAARLEAGAILDALSRGDFYATTGVQFADLRMDACRLTIAIKPDGGARYRTQFVGKGGRLLAETAANPASYECTGGEGYVRARVTDSNGLAAWTQPMPVPPAGERR